jgi:hypothetical protein
LPNVPTQVGPEAHEGLLLHLLDWLQLQIRAFNSLQGNLWLWTRRPRCLFIMIE